MEEWIFRIKKKQIRRAKKIGNLITYLEFSELLNDSVLGSSIKELHQILKKERSEIKSLEEREHLRDFISKDALLKFWKICINGEEIAYIFPFDYTASDTIGVLLLSIANSDCDYKSIETKYYLVSDFIQSFSGDGEIKYTEISEEEFRKKIQELSLQPLNSRLWKLIYRDHKLKSKDNDENF